VVILPLKLFCSAYFTQPPMRWLRICFTDIKKIPENRSRERLNRFSWNLPNDSGENVVSNVVPKWGLGPTNNFLGAKNYTLRTSWWRLANESEKLLYAGLLATALCIYGGCITNQMHEGVNACNLVYNETLLGFHRCSFTHETVIVMIFCRKIFVGGLSWETTDREYFCVIWFLIL